MKKIKRSLLIFTLLSAISLALAVVSLVLALTYFNKAVYVSMLVFLALVAIGVYVAIFSIFAAIDRKCALRFIPLLSQSEGDISAVAEKMGWSEGATKAFAEKCRAKGYI